MKGKRTKGCKIGVMVLAKVRVINRKSRSLHSPRWTKIWWFMQKTKNHK